MVYKVITWDYKEDAPLGKIAEAVRELARGAVDFREVDDTGGDLYAVVVADHPLNPAATERYYNREE